MSRYKSPDLQERQSDAVAAKKAQLSDFHSAAADLGVGERAAARKLVSDARLARATLRSAAKKLAEGEKAKLAEIETARKKTALQDEQEASVVRAAVLAGKDELDASLAADQKARRDVRYAARKAKKPGRKS